MCALSAAAMAQAQPKIDAACRAKYAKLYFTDSLGTVLPYRLLTPEKVDSDTVAKYPVLLFLHGAGERGSDNEVQLSYIDTVFASSKFRREHPCYVIVPQCAVEYRWCETDWTRTWHTMPKNISKYLHAANALLDSIAALPDADTMRLTPAFFNSAAFDKPDPPSTEILKASFLRFLSSFSLEILSIEVLMNSCPLNPGLTLIISTKSTKASISSSWLTSARITTALNCKTHSSQAMR